MATFRMVEGEGYEETLTRTENGFEGTRAGITDTADKEVALQSIGLPAIGSSWSSQRLKLKLRSYTVERIGMTSCRVTLNYSTAALDVLPTVLKPGEAVTTEEWGSTVVTKFFPEEVIDPDPPHAWIPPKSDYKPALNQGRGVAVEVGTLDLIVQVAYDLTQFTTAFTQALVLRMEEYHTKSYVNSGDVSVPNYLDTGFPRVFSAGRLRYKGGSRKPLGDLIVMEHRVGVAEDWLYRDDLLNGKAGLDRARQTRIFKTNTFDGLWPPT